MPAETKRLSFPFELKSLDEKGRFTGYGSVFDVVDHVMDRVKKGAFARTLSEHAEKGTMPLMFLNHAIGRQCGEWLEMKEDDRGLWCSGLLWIDGPNPDADALKAYRGMKAQKGRMGLSIGYDIRPGGAAYDSKTGITDLTDLDLWEVSPVGFPCCDPARVESVKTIKTSIREFERFLRESGFSRSEATAIAAKGFKAIGQGEPDQEVMEQARKTLEALKI